jgi:hypothetical protein
MKKIILGLALLINFSSFGQIIPNDHGETIVKQAIEMGDLLLNKNYEKFIEKIYPPLIETAGGKENFLKTLDQGLIKLRTQGITIDTLKFLPPNEIINKQNELQTTMTEYLVMSIPNGKMITKSTLIVVSYDNGLTWYFLETSDRDLKTMQEQFSNLSDELIIPPAEKPRVYKDK